MYLVAQELVEGAVQLCVLAFELPAEVLLEVCVGEPPGTDFSKVNLSGSP